MEALAAIVVRLEHDMSFLRALCDIGAPALVALEGAIWHAIGELEGERAPWVSDPPTEPGFYWVQSTKPDATLVEVYSAEPGQLLRARSVAHAVPPSRGLEHRPLSEVSYWHGTRWSSAVRFDAPPEDDV